MFDTDKFIFMNNFIELSKIIKCFAKTAVLKSVDLTIRQGEIFGLLGVNGAGKTTLIRSLLGLIKTNSGSVSFKGLPRTDKDVQEYFGFLPENFFPPKNLKALELLKILGWGYGLSSARVEGLLEDVGLKEHRNKYIGAFSRGMIQR